MEYQDPHQKSLASPGDTHMLDAALAYATHGWPVLPIWWVEDGRCACGSRACEHPGKHPIGKLASNGRNSASVDSETIKAWWAQRPQANVGIATGLESGLVVIDLDPRNGSEASLKRLELEHGSLPGFTVAAITGGGGSHIYLEHPGHHVKSGSAIAGYAGIDVKADGGYVLAPPSNHVSGWSYSWKIPPGQHLAPCPEWLLKLLGEPPKQEDSRNCCGDSIPKGQRNTNLTALAGSMRRQGMGPEEIEAALLVVNTRCNPPLEEAEIHRISRSVSRYEPALPVATTSNPEKTYLPVPPAFPIEVFPPSCQRAIAKIQRAYGVPIEIPACAFLGTAGGCIGRTRGLRIKPTWIEHANLWLAIVAPSGYGKSPAVREIQRPIFALEKRWFAEYQEALEQYNVELEQRRLAPKDERDPVLPKRPEWRQLIVDDTTTEALTDAFAANPRGILWNRDELSGMLQDLDKYSKKEGGTKARMMSAHDSGYWKVNRGEASKRAYISNATLSIFGTIQPKALPNIFSDLDAATGFLPRFIFVIASRETPPLWTDEAVSVRTQEYLGRIFERLYGLDFDGEGDPVIIGVDPAAKRLYETWFNEQALEPWQHTEAEVYEAVLAKLRGQCLRIALILHCLEAVDAGRPDTAPVKVQTMEKAINLANWFKVHQRNSWESIVNQKNVAELSPVHRQVARAILSLEGEIIGGMLATATITERVNQKLDPRFHLSADSVGKTAAALSLTNCKLAGGSARGFKVSESDLQRLKALFRHQSSVLSVQSVHSSDQPEVSRDKVSDQEVSHESSSERPAGHLGPMTALNENPGNTHGLCHLDASDTSGASPEPNLITSKARAAARPFLFSWNRRRQAQAAITSNLASLPDLSIIKGI